MRNTKISLEHEIEKIEKQLTHEFSGNDRKLLLSALKLAHAHTKGKYRKNGDPAMIHPIMTALRVSKVGLGINSVCAALLHDIIGDNLDIPRVKEHIQKECNEDVANLVVSMTLIENNPSESIAHTSQHYTELHFMSTIKDVRVLIIKLADVLHNLETIEGLSPERQLSFAHEVEKMYLPASEFLGISFLYKSLETTLFKFRHPDEYATIDNYISTHVEKSTDLLEQIIDELSKVVELSEAPGTVHGRLKSIPSIYKKLIRYSKEGKPATITNLRDILAFRILTETEKDCYTILSTLSALYTFEDEKTDDYIAKSKPNGYRAIHIVALTENGYPFEIQICTYLMHKHNEFGPSSHIAYKKQGRRNADASDEFSWVANLNEQMKYYQRFDDKPIPIDLFQDRVFVLTPAYEFFMLPKGATAIDLAYAVHTELGNQCVGAKVNGKTIPLRQPLHSGDIVEIVKNSRKMKPDPLWLDFVATEKAKKLISEATRKY